MGTDNVKRAIKEFALSSNPEFANIPLRATLCANPWYDQTALSLRTYEDVLKMCVVSMLGGSTDLRGPGYYAGDLSGITAKKAPFWFSPFYKPGKQIAKEKDWNKKLEQIVEEAPNWDIGFLTGVPAWIQMCMELIMKDTNQEYP
jgi:hypothetical protein